MKKLPTLILLAFFVTFLYTCTNPQSSNNLDRIPVIFDTDANNELDDQHALAYLIFNDETFDIKAVTVNTTRNGGNIDEQYAEAERVMTLCEAMDDIPLLKGADGSFDAIKGELINPDFDGAEAVNFIIGEAKKHKDDKLVVIAVGKLTNVALAVQKEPSIAEKIRLVWLGANYPDPGEYNLENDIPSMNYLLKTNIAFEMVTVRYGKPSGTDAVKVTKEEAMANMPGLGPTIETPITGRHGGEFTNFGNYSVNLFEHIDYYGNPPARALFDMAAVAIVKNPDWAKRTVIPSPIMVDEVWMDQPGNARKISVWEYFDKDNILSDFYATLKNAGE